jgi:hypothetical protein
LAALGVLKLNMPERYKNIKYGEDQDNVDYYHTLGLLYTVCVHSDYFVLLTITRKPRKEVKYKRG